MAIYNEKISEMVADNLIASVDVKTITQSVTIASGSGVLKRGAVINMNAAGKGQPVGTASTTAHGILYDDVDATSADVVAEVYIAGAFNKNAVVEASGKDLTADDIKNLRFNGVYLENAVQY